MTTLVITPKWKEKTAKFKGAIAAGEHIRVSIVNDNGEGEPFISDTATLRLRVVGVDGSTLAQFPLPVEEGETLESWDADVSPLQCVFNLNTVQMLKAVPPAANAQLLFVLDDYENKTLFFKDFCEVAHWPRRTGEEEPVDLDGYSDILAETQEAIAGYETRVATVETAVAEAVETANSASTNASNAVTIAGQAWQAAITAQNSAAASARQAEEAQGFAETAKAGAEAAKGDAVAAKNAAEAAVGTAQQAAVDAAASAAGAASAATSAVAVEKTRAESAENSLRSRIEAEETARANADANLSSELATAFRSVSYDSVNKRIVFYRRNGATEYLDATAFVKDGMVSSVAIQNGNLVITFNTDSGKSPISIPITSIFNPSNYYDKTAATNKFVAKESGKRLMTDAEIAKLAGIQENANAYTLPVASNGTLGGVKVGENLMIDSRGVLNAIGGGGDAKTIPLSYATLKAARDDGLLVPGKQYRITDYVATVYSAYDGASSANNPFDLIVTADSTNTLNEKARAVRHAGDSYFPASTKFEAWQVWYCLDNDDARFNWADITNGKGVIYRLIDEFRNDVPYDFKGILVDGPEQEPVYTFYRKEPSMIDASLSGACKGNTIAPFDADGLHINRITMREACANNTFGANCYDISLDYNCNGCAFGSWCGEIHIGSNNTNIQFGNGCYSITLGDFCSGGRWGDGVEDVHIDPSGNTEYGCPINRAAGYRTYYPLWNPAPALPSTAFPIQVTSATSGVSYTLNAEDVFFDQYFESTSDEGYVLRSYIDIGDIYDIAYWNYDSLNYTGSPPNVSAITFNGATTPPPLDNVVELQLLPWAVNSIVDEGFFACQIGINPSSSWGDLVDLVWTFDCSDSATAPEIRWPENCNPANDDEDNLVAEAGKVNVFYLSEVYPGGFIVARQVLPARESSGSSSYIGSY